MQSCGSAFSFCRCGSGSSYLKNADPDPVSIVVKNIKDCTKVRNNGAFANCKGKSMQIHTDPEPEHWNLNPTFYRSWSQRQELEASPALFSLPAGQKRTSFTTLPWITKGHLKSSQSQSYLGSRKNKIYTCQIRTGPIQLTLFEVGRSPFQVPHPANSNAFTPRYQTIQK